MKIPGRFLKRALCLVLITVLAAACVPAAGAGEGPDLITGSFVMQPPTDGDPVTDTYYFSDSYFDASGAIYNDHLSTMSAALAFSISGTSDTPDEAFGTLLRDIGFSDIETWDMDHTAADSMGTVIGSKSLGDTVLIDIRPKGEWCECLFPEDLNIKVTSTPKSGASFGDDKQYMGTEHPIHINVLKNRTWFSRCLWVLLTIMGLSLLIVYFVMLLRKNRFKKYARIKHTYMELIGSIRRESDEQEGFRLRRKGFLAWVNRWLVPFPDEKRTEQINTPPAGSMTFVAADSREYVNFTRASFDPDKMEMGDYDMENDEVDGKKPELIEMTDPIRITEKKRYEGQLIFDPGFKNDERGYRTFIGALILICAASIVTLLVLMIKSFGIF